MKNMSQIGSSPEVGVKIKYVWNHDPVEDGHHTFKKREAF